MTEPTSVNESQNPIAWFRDAAPYINIHREKVFVIMFSGEAIEHENFKQLIHDFALLNSLGIKLVLIHGARPQIDKKLAQQQQTTPIVNGLRITKRACLNAVLDAVGSTRLTVEALLTMGLGNSAVISERIDVVSGNYVIAKPYGIRDGIDFELTGMVRSIDTKAINNNLQNNQIVLLGSIGYSTTGEVFNLLAEQVAVKTAIALNAEKLIFIGKEHNNLNFSNKRDFTADSLLTDVQTYQQSANTKTQATTANPKSLPLELKRHFIGGAKACIGGVNRAHIVSYQQADSLLKELFTTDGVGTLISANPFEHIQPAHIDDVVGLIDLLTPLEDKGILVKRSREKLEREISHFIVAKIDNSIIGCAALYPILHPNNQPTHIAEIACVAVHPKYRKNKRGEKLLAFLEERSKKQGIKTLFVLTTQTAHWFMEQGFSEAKLTDLPIEKQKLYNHQRNSKIYTKQI